VEGLKYSGDQTKGACLVPKRAMNVMRGEVNRVLQLCDAALVPITWQVPRKVSKKAPKGHSMTLVSTVVSRVSLRHLPGHDRLESRRRARGLAAGERSTAANDQPRPQKAPLRSPRRLPAPALEGQAEVVEGRGEGQRGNGECSSVENCFGNCLVFITESVR